MKRVGAWVLFVYALAGANWAFAEAQADALAKYQAEHQKAAQQAQELSQQLNNTQAVILRLEGAIAALTELEKANETTTTDPSFGVAE